MARILEARPRGRQRSDRDREPRARVAGRESGGFQRPPSRLCSSRASGRPHLEPKSTTTGPPEWTDEERRLADHPEATAPERQRQVDAHGLSIAVWEWGDEGAPPMLLAHGGFDFGRTYASLAPLLASAGWRVVSFDQRGHGDSQHARLYSWDADLRDTLAVLDATTHDALPVVGHSKGGSLLTMFTEACPHRVSHLVNIDGLPSRRRSPDVADHERARLRRKEVEGWLDHRRRTSGLHRRPGTLRELAERRGRMNPRLTPEWLCYLVTAGARKDPDGWRWKIDPAMRMGGFGPWRPDWSLQKLPSLSIPMLGLLALQNEPMSIGTRPEDLAPYLPEQARIEAFPDNGHFIHIENPRGVADVILDFLADAR